ncbi:dimethyladenosine transferase [Vibrio mediterranei AK1]|nr:dimethyladenosine transferase [Vibrio mediterranei AK1]
MAKLYPYDSPMLLKGLPIHYDKKKRSLAS